MTRRVDYNQPSAEWLDGYNTAIRATEQEQQQLKQYLNGTDEWSDGIRTGWKEVYHPTLVEKLINIIRGN